MKTIIKSIFIIIFMFLGIIIIDAVQAKIFNHSPIIRMREDFNGGNLFYIDKGFLAEHYYCVNNDEKTVFKWEKYDCPKVAIEQDNNKDEDKYVVREIVDTTKTITNFGCAEVLEEFYRDDYNIYYFNCLKSNYIEVRYQNGKVEKITDALKLGHIKVTDLDTYKIDYIKYVNTDFINCLKNLLGGYITTEIISPHEISLATIIKSDISKIDYSTVNVTDNGWIYAIVKTSDKIIISELNDYFTKTFVGYESSDLLDDYHIYVYNGQTDLKLSENIKTCVSTSSSSATSISNLS